MGHDSRISRLTRQVLMRAKVAQAEAVAMVPPLRPKGHALMQVFAMNLRRPTRRTRRRSKRLLKRQGHNGLAMLQARWSTNTSRMRLVLVVWSAGNQ